MRASDVCKKLEGQLFRENYWSYNHISEGKIAHVKHYGCDVYGFDVIGDNNTWIGFFQIHLEDIDKALEGWHNVKGDKGFQIIKVSDVVNKEKQEAEELNNAESNTEAPKEVEKPKRVLNEEVLNSRVTLELWLKNEGALNAHALIGVMNAFMSLFENKVYRKRMNAYNADYSAILCSLFVQDKEYWNTLLDRGLKLYNRSRTKLLSPSYLIGFIAWQTLKEKVEEKPLYDFFSILLGVKRTQDNYLRVTIRFIKSNCKTFKKMPSEGTQGVVLDAWEYYYVNLYKHNYGK